LSDLQRHRQSHQRLGSGISRNAPDHRLDFFGAMTRFYVRAAPPTSPLLLDYGRDFPDFIERYEYAQSVPWLADVARIERAWLDAYHAPDVQPLMPHELAAIPSERVPNTVLKPHPATHFIRSCFGSHCFHCQSERHS
jgi:hypothetical protein